MKLKKDYSVLIIAHYEIRSEKSSTVAHELKNFLSDKVNKITFIELPFTYAPEKYAYCSIYKNNKKIKEIKTKIRSKIEPLEYIEHSLIIWYFLLKTSAKFNLALALDNLSAVAVYPLRLVNSINYLIFYAIDYVPKRFENKLLNSIYFLIDKTAFNVCDHAWGVSERMLKIRAKNKNKKYSVVPIGIHTERTRPKKINQINPYELVYMGSILKKQGVQIAIKSLPELIKAYPKITLQIYGRGEYEDKLKKMAKRLNVTNKVVFHGYTKDHSKLEEKMSKSAVALAPYIPQKDSFTFFADPSKLKQYIGVGLPVVTTNVSYFSEILKKAKAGVIMKYSKESFVDSVKFLIGNNKRLALYKKNAVKLSKNYNIEKIIKQAFSSLPEKK